MDTNPPRSNALALEPIDGEASDDESVSAVSEEPPAAAQPKNDLHITTADGFLAEAAKEYQEGRIDAALWRRAAELGGGDEALVTAAYLRSRATALQLQRKQEGRSQGRGQSSGSARGEIARKRKVEAHEDAESEQDIDVAPRGSNAKLKYIAAAAAGLASTIVVVCVMVAMRQSESATPPITAAATPPANEQPVVKSPGSIASEGVAEPSLEARAQELKKAGNWNVFVLYASEWTRKEPNNAAAWNELSIGYARLLQFGDALAAATKAAELSPDDPQLWRNLGQLNVAVDRLPEAGAAFDKALALNPDDADSLCAAAAIAQRQRRPKDADAIALRVKATDGGCTALSSGDNAVVVAAGSTLRKPPASGTR